MPRTGIFIISAILTAFSTIIPTSSCGEVTTIIPSTGIDWNTVSGTSPVPGGISMNIKSTSSQTTSVQNCFTAPAITGPRQITGAPSSSSSKFSDIILIPVFDTPGKIPSSLPCALSLIPNIFGIDGPVTSASIIAVLYPSRALITAQSAVTVDLPTPPLPLTTPITFLILLFAFCSAKRLLSSEHFDEQLSQL